VKRQYDRRQQCSTNLVFNYGELIIQQWQQHKHKSHRSPPDLTQQKKWSS